MMDKMDECNLNKWKGSMNEYLKKAKPLPQFRLTIRQREIFLKADGWHWRKLLDTIFPLSKRKLSRVPTADGVSHLQVPAGSDSAHQNSLLKSSQSCNIQYTTSKQQNYIPTHLGKVCGVGVWISSSLDSALQTWAHTGCCRHSNSSLITGTLQDCCCHPANLCSGNQKQQLRSWIDK